MKTKIDYDYELVCGQCGEIWTHRKTYDSNEEYECLICCSSLDYEIKQCISWLE